MAELEAKILDILAMIEKRPSIDVKLVAKELGVVLAKGRFDALDDLHRGMVFGVCQMTPTRGSWDEIPDDTRAILVKNVAQWIPFVETSPRQVVQPVLTVD